MLDHKLPLPASAFLRVPPSTLGITSRERPYHGDVTHCLSRYGKQWYLTAAGNQNGRARGNRIVCALNKPEDYAPGDNYKTMFWFNPNVLHTPYNQVPHHLFAKIWMDPMHLLFGSDKHRLIKRVEPVKTKLVRPGYPHQPAPSIPSVWVEKFEVLVSEEGLLRQCIHCDRFEGMVDKPGSWWFPRFEHVSDDLFCCPVCARKTWLSFRWFKMVRRIKVWYNPRYGRPSIYEPLNDWQLF